MYRNPLIYLTILTAFVFASCSKSLDMVPTSAISNASFWKSEDDVNGAIAGMYVQLRAFTQMDMFLLGELRGETFWSDGLVGDTYERYHKNTLDATVYPGPTWMGIYKVINSANLILKYTGNIPFRSEAAKNKALAQAHAMRAFMYFVLARTWGDVPLRTLPTESYDPELTYLEKSPVAAVFELIRKDIESAVSLFPDNNFATGRSVWSKAAVNALKADVYLWTGKQLNGGESDFRTALAAAQSAAGSDVVLLDNFSRLFDYDNKGNKEVLMAVRFQQYEVEFNYFRDMYMPSHVLPANLPGDVLNVIGVTGGNIILSPSALLREQFEQDDLRRNASFLEIKNSNGGYFASIPLKGQGLVFAGVRYFIDDIVLYRHADVLLMIAEAKNALNQDPSTEINLVRARAFGSNYAIHKFETGTQVENDAAILKERMLELCFEGKRWWDLVRFNKAFELVPSLKEKEAQKHLLFFPIPATVLSLEPKVTQIKGYEK